MDDETIGALFPRLDDLLEINGMLLSGDDVESVHLSNFIIIISKQTSFYYKTKNTYICKYHWIVNGLLCN